MIRPRPATRRGRSRVSVAGINGLMRDRDPREGIGHRGPIGFMRRVPQRNRTALPAPEGTRRAGSFVASVLNPRGEPAYDSAGLGDGADVAFLMPEGISGPGFPRKSLERR